MLCTKHLFRLTAFAKGSLTIGTPPFDGTRKFFRTLIPENSIQSGLPAFDRHPVRAPLGQGAEQTYHLVGNPYIRSVPANAANQRQGVSLRKLLDFRRAFSPLFFGNQCCMTYIKRLGLAHRISVSIRADACRHRNYWLKNFCILNGSLFLSIK
jgi:hypothetical protein